MDIYVKGLRIIHLYWCSWSGNACYHWVQILLSFRLLFKNL